MEKIKEIWANHKKTILIVGGLIVAVFVWRKIKK